MLKELIILIGNIGSGKSTLSDTYQKDGHIVISRDSLRYAIGGGNYVFNLEYETALLKAEQVLFTEFLEMGKDIIIDAVNSSRMTRTRYILPAKEKGYIIKAIELPKLSKQESVDRRLNDPHGNFSKETWEEVWEMFDGIYQSPSIEENFDLINNLKKEK